MVFRAKKAAQPIKKVEPEEEYEEEEEAEEEAEDKEEPDPITKQEVLDIIEGHLQRALTLLRAVR